ncbi:N-6 DNA methylase [Pseudoalteromonas sp. MMG013]|uniref:N-6 DNA methylase n=1 Tax=Pseudoalteromonas sp. MMG013 TaxID=2822687 RepID=UPI001B37FF67|nr:N-6 DNA methylase [Pseudoalteromonas sp. MMG013]MBQ4864706.1 N-6 DNA methylase [Pseudoalteromonas sp. MMG013]
MNNYKNKLANLTELIRKDSAINNAIDAVEQLSLILLIKYFYDIILVDTPRTRHVSSFRNLFNVDDVYGSRDTAIDFYTLRRTLEDIVNDIDSNEIELIEDSLAFNTWKIVDKLLNEIPFRIRSSKILNEVLFRLENIDILECLTNEFDELISSMVKSSKASGAFYTPKSLIDALVKVTKPKVNDSVYDPAMGTARTFVATKEFLSSNNDSSRLKVKGNDINPFAYLIGVLNLLVNNIDISDISLSDSLLTQGHSKYDVIISGIPFGIVSEFSRYEYAYHGYQGNLEAMFLKHTMDKLNINGRAALIVPEGVLFNGTNHLDSLRYQLLTQFNLHSILSLPNGTLAPYTGVKVSVLFFDKTPPGKDIWFYDLATNKNINKRTPIKEDDFSEFISLFESREICDRACLIDKELLLNNKSYNLSISLPNKEEAIKFDKSETIEELKTENSKLTRSIANYFDITSRNISVGYSEPRIIKSIGKLRTGDNLTKSELLENGRFPVYGGNGIIGYFEEANRHENTIIIGKVGLYCGNIHFSEEPFWLTNNAISLEVIDTSNVFIPYLAHLLRGLDLNKLSTGAVQKFLSIKQLNDIEVSLPSYKKQVELSNWFSELEDSKTSIQELLSAFNDELGLITKNIIVEKAIKH